MKTAIALALVLGVQITHAGAPHLEPYLKANAYQSLRPKLPMAPKRNSRLQAEDQKELVRLVSKRTELDCAAAEKEETPSLDIFFGEILSSDETRKLSEFFDRIRKEIGPLVSKAKKEFHRQRPFAYIPGVRACKAEEDDNSAYPSGHAVLASLEARLLADLYPDRQAKFLARGREIGQHRVIAGMHHPSDIAAGAKMAELIHSQLRRSQLFRADFARLKAP